MQIKKNNLPGRLATHSLAMGILLLAPAGLLRAQTMTGKTADPSRCRERYLSSVLFAGIGN